MAGGCSKYQGLWLASTLLRFDSEKLQSPPLRIHRPINAIKNMLDYALYRQQENIDIPEDHQELVLDRFQKSRKDPKRLMDWDDDQQPGFGKSFRTQPLNK